MSSQKALFLESFHGNFSLRTRPIPSPKPGELLIKIRAYGLNPIDWKVQALDFSHYVKDYPAVLGSDVAGDVVEVGEGVEGWAKGDRVFFQGWFGSNDYAAYQEYTLISADLVARIPERFTYSQAATIPVAYVAAAFGLLAPSPLGAGLNPTFDPTIKFTGQAALVIGGSTTVGQYTIQLLKYLEFNPIIAYASNHQTRVSFLRSLGATDIIDRKSVPLEGLDSAVKDITTAPVKVVFDTVATKESRQAGYACVPEGGYLISTLPTNKIPIEEHDSKSYSFVGVQGIVHLPGRQEFGREMYKHLEKFVEDGVIVPAPVEELPSGLNGIVDGLERLKQGQVSGVKLVGHPDDTI